MTAAARLHVHSDCEFFAGCENMIANLVQDEGLRREYRITFSYRRSVAYETGLRRRVAGPVEAHALPLVDFHQATGLAGGLPGPVRGLWKIAMRLLLVKYWLTLWNAAVLYRELGGEVPSVVHVNNGGLPGAVSCPSAALAARLRGVPGVVCVINNIARPYDGLDRLLDYPLDRLLAASVSIFVTGSAHARRALIEVLRLPEELVVCLPNGIAPRAPDETAEATRLRLGTPAERPLVAVVAVLEPRKGHEPFLRALKRLKDGRGAKALPFIVVEGRGSQRDTLAALRENLGLANDVMFIEQERNIFNLMNAADVISLPSIAFEDFPNVILEAMSLGKPVLASRLAGIPEQIEDGRSGLLAEPGDEEAWAAALGRLTDDAPLRGALGRAGREAFERRFTAAASVDGYRRLYSSLRAGAP